jgi:hypothetical protein
MKILLPKINYFYRERKALTYCIDWPEQSGTSRHVE